MRKIKRLLAGVLMALVLLFGLSIAYLVSPYSQATRTVLLERVLSRVLDRHVEIDGDAKLQFGDELTITASSIRLARVSDTRQETRWHSVGSGSLSLPYTSLLFGEPHISRVRLKGAKAFIEQRGKDEPLKQRHWDYSDVAEFTGNFLKDPLARDFVLEDLTLSYPDRGNGWEAVFEIERWSSEAKSDENTIVMAVQGSLNQKPFAVQATFPDPNRKPKGPLNIAVTTEGLAIYVSGSLDLKEPTAEITAKLNAPISSLGDIQSLFDINRVVEGDGRLEMALAGPLNALGLDNIKLDVKLVSGSSMKLTGTVGNLPKGTGIDLLFDSRRFPEGRDPAKPKDPSEITLTGLTGQILGDERRLYLKNFKLLTNAIEGELKEIGPIWVDRIVRDTKGNVGFLGLNILSGPADDPVLDLKGSITNLLKFSGIRIGGSFDFGLGQFIAPNAPKAKIDAGSFAGTLFISDASGILELEQFDGRTRNSKLVDLSVSKIGPSDNAKPETGRFPVFEIDVKVPDFNALQKRLGLKGSTVKKVAYKGTATYQENSVALKGAGLVGQTNLAGNLSLAVLEDSLKLTGDLNTPKLYLADVESLIKVYRFIEGERNKAVAIEEVFTAPFTASVDFAAKSIAGGGKTASNMSAKLLYARKVLKFNPIRLTYLGGKANATVHVDTHSKPAKITADGRIDKLKMGTVLKELGIPRLVSGSLSMSYNLTGTGSNFESFRRSASGKLVASLWGGTIGTRLIDLAGQSLVRWMFSNTSKEDQAKLVCAVFPLTLKAGRGQLKNAVVETENVQVVGGGKVDLRDDKLELKFAPRALAPDVVDMASDFTVVGPIKHPRFKTKDSSAGRVVGEVLTTPLNLLGVIFGSKEKGGANKHRPCSIIKSRGAK
ncbi:AsmA family protein [Rhodobacteraceae bacterium RKSG542]|uniref:AsmA family protein n=1 Tax=Pseudovibrio flavus TaxID=2529854 RepID=UPI0012BBA70C|nr:AsmA-like C-terminal region-containing protein [Pseudovibrio flavus]MTI17485.1 AsmA family protein [Pseudovibrio flavus]